MGVRAIGPLLPDSDDADIAWSATCEKHVEIRLPHTEITELFAPRTDAPGRLRTASDGVWQHRGRPISHGSNATHPTTIWSARRAGAGQPEVWFGGSARFDPFTTARCGTSPEGPININAVNGSPLRLRVSTQPSRASGRRTERDGGPGQVPPAPFSASRATAVAAPSYGP